MIIDKKVVIIIILILFFIIYMFYNCLYFKENLVIELATVDNEQYYVRNSEDKSKAANTLATIKNNIKKLVLHLKNNINEYIDEKEYINNLVNRTKQINIMETPAEEKNTSYTINKGEKIVICLRSKLLNEIHDINTIMYVVIHELAHVACPEFGHTPLFKQIFIFLLKVSQKINIYNPIDYRKNPQDYCGMTINEYLLR
jgi:predicted metal-dependent hydrolase